jgi:glutamyl-Q tRNA(Asp) synthetase
VIRYIGRFAPSPTGPLHAGSLVAALASWLDAKAHGGQWLVRIEDVDTTRCLPGMDEIILQQLAACGLHSDGAAVVQSQRTHLYQKALDTLICAGDAYACTCSRRDIELALQRQGQAKHRHGELVYPGTCRAGLQGKTMRAWRFNTSHITNKPLPLVNTEQSTTLSVANDSHILQWSDRRLGPQQQDVATEVGDFILKRADGCFAYQLAVVVDDAEQGITHVVRGEDLADNTARQILLQHALHLHTPSYLHTPLVMGANGEKLSKQNGATALDTSKPLLALNQAATALGLAPQTQPSDAMTHWVSEWRALSSALVPCRAT